MYSRPHVLLTTDGTSTGQFMCAAADSESRKLGFFTNEARNSPLVLGRKCPIGRAASAEQKSTGQLLKSYLRRPLVLCTSQERTQSQTLSSDIIYNLKRNSRVRETGGGVCLIQIHFRLSVAWQTATKSKFVAAGVMSVDLDFDPGAWRSSPAVSSLTTSVLPPPPLLLH